MISLLHPWKATHGGLVVSCAMLMAAMLMPRTAAAQWTKVDAPGVSSVYFYDVEFRNALEGHAIGIAPTGTFVYSTTDGGSTWALVKGIGLAPASFNFLDGSVGIIGGRATACKCMSVTRSTDGGKTWKVDPIRTTDGKVEEIPGYGVNVMTFPTSTIGYAVGLAMIAKTTDGGVTWTRQEIGSTTDFVSDAHAPTPDRVYAIAAPDLSSASYILYRTIDGGAHWDRTPVFIDGAGFQEIQFISAEVGFVGGYDADNTLIYKTTDGGDTWSKKYEGSGAASSIFGIEFADQNIGYAVGGNGLILRTSDGGDTWKEEEAGTNDMLVNLSISGGNVVVVGQNGTILRRSVGASGVGSERPAGTGSLLAPNPVTTTAAVSNPALAREGSSLVICDLLGSEVRRITGGPGMETVRFSREGLSSGTYLYRVMVGTEILATGTMEVR